MFAWLDTALSLHATEVLNVTPERGPDGQSYVRLHVVKNPLIASSVAYTDTAVLSPSQRAYARTRLLSGNNPIEAGDDVTDSDVNSGSGVLGWAPSGHNGAQEHPGLRATLLDLDPALPLAAQAAALAQHLLAPDTQPEPRQALRGGTWLAPRLARVPAAPSTAALQLTPARSGG